MAGSFISPKSGFQLEETLRSLHEMNLSEIIDPAPKRLSAWWITWPRPNPKHSSQKYLVSSFLQTRSRWTIHFHWTHFSGNFYPTPKVPPTSPTYKSLCWFKLINYSDSSCVLTKLIPIDSPLKALQLWYWVRVDRVNGWAANSRNLRESRAPPTGASNIILVCGQICHPIDLDSKNIR